MKLHTILFFVKYCIYIQTGNNKKQKTEHLMLVEVKKRAKCQSNLDNTLF